MAEAAVGTPAPAGVDAAEAKTLPAQAGQEETRRGGPSRQQPPQGETPQARRARYEALVRGKGEFADLFREDTQRAVQGRLAQAQKAMEAQRPVMDLLARRYGTQDMEGLRQALERDASWWSAYAQAQGLTEEQARARLGMEARRDHQRRQTARQEGQRRAEAQVRLWAREAQELQGRYPEFDLRTALADETFQSLLRARVPMKAAYEVANLERVKQTVAARAAREAERRLTSTIQANGTRPVEGGASGAPGSSVKPDPGRMSETEILELMERARRGEKIIF